jgi:hypothetical protein
MVIMARIRSEVRARVWENDRDLLDWYCSEHGHIATTEVGADLCCCPECEAEVEAKAEREAERRMDEEYERARGFYKPDSPD